MAKTAFVLGGTGMIGRAVARRLVDAGWHVTVASRRRRPLPDDVRAVALDRRDDAALAAALGDGVDVLVDVIAFDARHARQLLALAGRIGSLVAISSASVYADASGRSLDEATGEDDFPELPVPIPEAQRTVEPGAASYSTRKVELERALLEQETVPATVIRPCAVHGPGSELPRELFFVKRARDRRRFVLLAYRGESVFHTTSVANLAELVRLAAETPGTRVLNCGDPEPPTALEIGRAVAHAVGYELVECLVPGRPDVARNPWAAPRPLVVDTTAAEMELAYRPVTTYDEAVVATCRWLVDERVEPSGYLASFFDYDAEDAFLRGLAP